MSGSSIPSIPSTKSVPARFSPSALERFGACPKAFAYQYVDKERGVQRPSGALVVGNAVHAALERFFGLEPGHRTVEMLERAYRSVWRDHVPDGLFSSRDEEAQSGLAGLEMLRSYAEWGDLSVRPREREVWVQARLANGLEVFGKVDRLDESAGGLVVVDYKTGRNAATAEGLPGLLAAQVYAVAAAAQYGQPVAAVRLVYLALSREVEWELGPGELDAAAAALESLTSDIHGRSEFEARPGAACRFCAYADRCEDRTAVKPEQLVVPAGLAF